MDSIAPLDKEASDAFRMCLGHSDSEDPSYYLGVKSVRSYNGEVSWVHGSTLGMPQVANASNERSDSLAWLKAWSRFMSLSISATPDFLRKIHLTKRHFFRRVLVRCISLPV